MKRNTISTFKVVLPFILFILTASIYLVLKGKEDSFLILYDYHSHLLNRFMYLITYLGDGTTACIISVLFLLYRIRWSAFLLGTWLISGLFVQLFKRFFFPDALRPMAYFRELGIELYRVPGLEIHMKHSFPSGHTATAFAIFLGLSLMIKNRTLRVFLFLLAILTAYSRIYLGQHFLTDIVAGSFFGVITSVFLYKFVFTRKGEWLDKSVQDILRKKDE